MWKGNELLKDGESSLHAGKLAIGRQ